MDEGLKQRLVGAAVIVVLAAVFVPMVFETSGPEATAPTAGGARQNDGRLQDGFTSSIVADGGNAGARTALDAADGTSAGSSGASEPATTEQSANAIVAGAAPEPEATPANPAKPVIVADDEPGPAEEPEPQSAPPAAPAPEPKPVAQAKPSPAPSPPATGEWVVQVASFNDVANAAALVSRLRAGGIDAFRRQATVGTRTLVRVYAGPTAHKDESEALAQRVEKSFKLKGLVVRNPAG